ncbi:MAG: epoxyqueuosine reductase QueH [Firmicutes bacterium]|nr:epoxyqueuosine reductase QueH [Bacillota bacterium]
MKTLAFACCGPCAIALASDVLEKPHLYFNGDCFDTREEYDRRLTALMTVNKSLFSDQKIFIAPYEPKRFETCEQCIEYRLEQCARAARENGFDSFTTSLTVSPHKDTTLINQIGAEVATRFGLKFVALDLKKGGGFGNTVKVSKDLGIYRQNYCGCKPR